MEMYRYYCIVRPPVPGAIPHKPYFYETRRFPERRYIPEIDRMAWGWVEYDEELTLQEVVDYELIMHPRESEP